MPDLAAILVQALAAAGGAAVVLVGFGRWLLLRFEKRLDQQWTKSFEEGMEELRAGLRVKENLLSIASASGAAGQQAAFAKRLEAIEALWATILDVRGSFGASLIIYEMMTRDEIARLDPMSDVLAPSLKSGAEFMAAYGNDRFAVEPMRPFLGERLWSLFWTYRAATMRASWRVAEGIEKGRIPQWDAGSDGADDPILQLFAAALTSAELKEARDKRFGGLGHALRLVEQKIIVEMEAWMSGRTASHEALARAGHVARDLGTVASLIQGSRGAS